MIIQCGNCGAKNRIPPERAGQTGRCGKCKSPLDVPVMPGRPLDVSGRDLDRALATHTVPVVVDFYSTTCGPCVALAPVLERLAAERRGRLVVVKVNVERDPQTAIRYGVRGVPVLVIVKDGREIDRIVGAPSEAELFRWVDAHL